jgi:hypothetical protein
VSSTFALTPLKSRHTNINLHKDVITAICTITDQGIALPCPDAIGVRESTREGIVQKQIPSNAATAGKIIRQVLQTAKYIKNTRKGTKERTKTRE